MDAEAAAPVDASTGATGVHAEAASEADEKEAEKTEVGAQLDPATAADEPAAEATVEATAEATAE